MTAQNYNFFLNSTNELQKKIEKCSVDVDFASSVFAKSGEREYADLCEKLDGVKAEDVEIKAVSAVSVIDEVAVYDGEVTLKGENIVRAIIDIE